MKFLVIFAILFSFTLANDLFVGSWKENQHKRKGLSDFLRERGKKFCLWFLICYHYYIIMFIILFIIKYNYNIYYI